MNRLSAILGYMVEIRDEVNGTSRTITVPMNRDEFFWYVLENADLFDPDDSENPEPAEVEQCAHFGENGAVIRLWSPLSVAEARGPVASLAADWGAAL